MKAFLQKYWHYVLILLALIVSVVGYLGQGVSIDTGKILSGDVAGVGAQVEAVPAPVTPAAPAATPAH